MKSFIFGHSSQNLPILAHSFGSGSNVLILGGVHGDETEGVVASLGLLEALNQNYPYSLGVTLVPALNIDGVLSKTRMNARGVDLNRNLNTKDWSPDVATPRYHPGPSPLSEPENQALVQYLERIKIKFILSLHSWKPLLNTNGPCEAVAKSIAAKTGYEISPTIGYSTPGCLGTFAGLERGIPTLTYEIERGLNPERVLKEHVPAVLAGIETMESTI